MFKDLRDYQDMQRIINTALQLQWNDLLKSGIIDDIYKNQDSFYRIEGNKKTLLIGLLLLFIKDKIKDKFKPIMDYNNLRGEFKNYLKRMSNKGGQSIVDKITNLRFRLSNKEYIDKIETRVNELEKGLDKTTITRFSNQVVNAVRQEDNRIDIFDNVMLRGNEIVENRSKVIIGVETWAIYNYMRQETANRNGCISKTWQSSGVPNMCPFCASLDGTRLPIDKLFEAGDFAVMQPPAHSSCQCGVYYEMNNLCSNYDYISKKNYIFYSSDDNENLKCVNPNAVWAGGESLVGDDKNIGNYYDKIKGLKGAIRDEMLYVASEELSKDGFIQLNLILK